MKTKRSKRLIKTRLPFKIRLTNPKLLEAAFTHPSFRYENPGRKLENFDRLEFFGDSVLNFVICRKLYAMFPQADEGVLSRLRSILVSRKILSRIAHEINLMPCLKIGRSLADQKDFLKGKISADAFEALIAAFYFDRGFDKTERFLLKHFRPYFDVKKLFRLDPNPKSTLQELVQKHWHKLPEYTSTQEEQGTQTRVLVTSKLKASAWGKSRKESEEKAARLLLRLLRQELLGRSKRKSSGKKL